jgi:hypothetical protein
MLLIFRALFYFKKGEISWNLMATLRIACAQSLDKKKFGKVLEDSPISKDSEKKTWELLSKEIAKLSTIYQECMQIYKQSSWPISEAVVQQFKEDLEILESVHVLCKSQE